MRARSTLPVLLLACSLTAVWWWGRSETGVVPRADSPGRTDSVAPPELAARGIGASGSGVEMPGGEQSAVDALTSGARVESEWLTEALRSADADRGAALLRALAARGDRSLVGAVEGAFLRGDATLHRLGLEALRSMGGSGARVVLARVLRDAELDGDVRDDAKELLAALRRGDAR